MGLCHASDDKPKIRKLYRRLQADGFKPWLDEREILAGQRWEPVIEKALREADVTLVCCSTRSVNKNGFVQDEIRQVLELALSRPFDSVSLIPVRLDDCDVPAQLTAHHHADLFRKDGYSLLKRSLQMQWRRLRRAPR